MDQQDELPVVVLQSAGMGPILSDEEGRRQMERIAERSPAWTQADFAAWLRSDTSDADDVVARFAIRQETLDEWTSTNKVLALKDVGGVPRFPLRQFDRLGPVAGLSAVADQFSGPKATWDFLVSPCRMFDMRPPIDALRDGQADEVQSVALAVRWGDFF